MGSLAQPQPDDRCVWDWNPAPQDLPDSLPSPNLPSSPIGTRRRVRAAPPYKVRVVMESPDKCGLCGAPTPLFEMDIGPGLRFLGRESKKKSWTWLLENWNGSRSPLMQGSEARPSSTSAFVLPLHNFTSLSTAPTDGLPIVYRHSFSSLSVLIDYDRLLRLFSSLISFIPLTFE